MSPTESEAPGSWLKRRRNRVRTTRGTTTRPGRTTRGTTNRFAQTTHGATNGPRVGLRIGTEPHTRLRIAPAVERRKSLARHEITHGTTNGPTPGPTPEGGVLPDGSAHRRKTTHGTTNR